MQRLIKDGQLTANEWHIAEVDADLTKLGPGKWFVPLNTLLANIEANTVNLSNVGPILCADDDVMALQPYVDQIQAIALRFENFMDGRSFSQARVLRDQLDFEGEIRALGNFIQDQLFYLSRCGVNAFLVPEDTVAESALQSLADFSETYQAASDEPQPLFRRRV